MLIKHHYIALFFSIAANKKDEYWNVVMKSFKHPSSYSGMLGEYSHDAII